MRTAAMDQAARITFASIMSLMVIFAQARAQESSAGDLAKAAQNPIAKTIQPFVNSNFSEGWYLTTSPIIIADWCAKSSDRWTLPIGGSFGRVFKRGEQPVNMRLAAYCNAITPSGGAS